MVAEEVAEGWQRWQKKAIFIKKWLLFEHFMRNYEQICINFRVKIMLIQQKHAQNRSKTI